MPTVNGETVGDCTITAKLYARTDGDGVGFVVDETEIASTFRTESAADGTWSLDLTANADIEPANTLWKITYASRLNNWGPSVYYIDVPALGGWIGDLLVDNPSLPSPMFPGGGGGTGSALTVKENGTILDLAVDALDFLGADFDLTESPDHEINIVVAAAIARQAALDSEIATRASADTTEAAARAAADTAEATTRASADTAEASTRATADTAETNARTTADAALIPLTQKAAANGVASLDANLKVPIAQLPPLSITETFVVGSQAAMLAANAQQGDVAIRTDINETFILAGSDATILSNWAQLLFPGGGGGVSSVNTRTGAVTGLAENSVTVTGGTGLTGGGDLSANRTISMPAVGTAGTYGDATHVVQVTTDTQGRVSGATAIAITGLAESAITNLVADLAAKANKTDNLSVFAATTSAQLRGVLSDETGTGAAVFATSPALVTPTGIVKGDVGLGNVDNVADASKPVSTAQAAADALRILDPSGSNDDVLQRKAGVWTNRTLAQLLTDLGLGSVATLTKILSGYTIPTSSIDKWKSGRSRQSTRLNGAISNSATTITVQEPAITPTTMHRRLTIESEEIFTATGEAAYLTLTGVTSVATTGIFTKTAHGLLAGQIVIPASGVLDSFLTVGTAYYVSATNLAANTFSLATTAGGTVLTGTTNDTNLTLNLYGQLTVTRGINGTAAVSHADKAPVYATKVKTVVHLGDSTVEGTNGVVDAYDGWTLRAARALSDRMGGVVGQSWPMWRTAGIDLVNQEYSFSVGGVAATNNSYDVGYNGALVFAGSSASTITWTRPAGVRVQAIDVGWIDYAAAGAQWSYSLDGGSTWTTNPVTSIYSSGKGLLRRTRIACNDPTTFVIRAADSAGTSKTIVLPWVPLTTWTVYPYPQITEGVHWANLGFGGVKLRSLLYARAVTDGVTNGTTTLTSVTAVFVANDVNSTIYVNGVAYTIASRTNATTVVLSGSPATATGVRLTILQGSGTGDWMANFLGHHGSWFPDLVVIGPFSNDAIDAGTNGDGNYNVYGDMLQFLITGIQPVADILLIAPHERDTSGVTGALQANYRATMHTIATANNVAILDLYDAFAAYGFTGYTAVNGGGYMADGVHFNYKGNNWIGAHLTRGLGML